MFPTPVSLQLPVNGVLTAVSDRWMHLDPVGPRATGRPTVLFEAGLGSFSSQWSLIQPRVASTTRTVSFDRPGLGWSSPSSTRLNARQHVRELHNALDQIGESGPYVFVGHSLGGLIARVFADEFPGETAGLVLIDSSHPDQLARMRRQAARYRGLGALGLAPQAVMTWLRYRAALRRADWPLDTASAIEHLQKADQARAATANERASFPSVLDEARGASIAGDIPLTVITAGKSMPSWHGLQRELATLSTDSHQVVVTGASHASLVTDDNHAAIVADEVVNMVARVPKFASTST